MGDELEDLKARVAQLEDDLARVAREAEQLTVGLRNMQNIAVSHRRRLHRLSGIIRDFRLRMTMWGRSQRRHVVTKWQSFDAVIADIEAQYAAVAVAKDDHPACNAPLAPLPDLTEEGRVS